MNEGRHRRGQSLTVLAQLGVPVLVVLVLYLGRDVLLPLALATLLSLVLVPIVNPLERWGVPRIIAVVLVAALTFGMLGGVIYVVGGQVQNMAASLPQYKENIKNRITALRGAGEDGALERAAEVVEDIRGEIAAEQRSVPAEGPLQAPTQMAEAVDDDDAGPEPVPVVIREPDPDPLKMAASTISPLLGPLATAGMIVVLVLFMLLQRDDLRDRMLWIAGATRLHVTTRAIDEGTGRISRYLLMQLVINVTYGVPVGVALWLIGVPGAALWGFLAILLRFIPYVGPWLGASMPILMSLAVFDGWTWPLIVAGMFIALELFSNNVLEPWLYGASTGMSPMSVLVAAIFWSWLWGPVGLVLAVPLTACLVVAGRHVPALRPVAVLLGDEPAFTPPQRFYQRLLAWHDDDAWDLAHAYFAEHGRVATIDRLLLPALCFAEIEHRRGHVDEEHLAFIHDTLREVLADHAPDEDRSAMDADGQPLVMLLSNREAGDLAATMFEQALLEERIAVKRLPPSVLVSEAAEQVCEMEPAIVCISAVPPGAARRARYLCLRIGQDCPQIPILAGLWSTTGRSDRTVRRLRDSGARWVVPHISDALPRIRQALGGKSPAAAASAPETAEHGG